MLYVEFTCHIIHVMLTGVCGNAAVEQGQAVCGCAVIVVCVKCGSVCVCVWGRGISSCMGKGVGVYIAGEWVQVLMEKRQYLPRCCGCGPKEPVCSLVHCV